MIRGNRVDVLEFNEKMMELSNKLSGLVTQFAKETNFVSLDHFKREIFLAMDSFEKELYFMVISSLSSNSDCLVIPDFRATSQRA